MVKVVVTAPGGRMGESVSGLWVGESHGGLGGVGHCAGKGG